MRLDGNILSKQSVVPHPADGVLAVGVYTHAPAVVFAGQLNVQVSAFIGFPIVLRDNEHTVVVGIILNHGARFAVRLNGPQQTLGSGPVLKILRCFATRCSRAVQILNGVQHQRQHLHILAVDFHSVGTHRIPAAEKLFGNFTGGAVHPDVISALDGSAVLQGVGQIAGVRHSLLDAFFHLIKGPS